MFRMCMYSITFAVFVAVPFYGIAECGLRGYLKEYLEPNSVLLPILIIGESTRTLALAVRLFGNAPQRSQPCFFTRQRLNANVAKLKHPVRESAPAEKGESTQDSAQQDSFCHRIQARVAE